MSLTKKVTQFNANTLLHALGQAQGWMKENAADDVCWFRGVKDSSLSLLPGAYWRTNYDEFDALLRFTQEGRAFAEIGEVDDWRTYYLAQHNGIPTRLLDWTENLITAMFFATDGWEGSTRPCVWIVRPTQINKLSFNWTGLISPERNEEVNAWMPTRIADGRIKIPTKNGEWVYDNSKPLALYPRKNNARMAAQQGTFTVHGTDRTPLDRWIVQNAPNCHETLLCKVIFSKRMKPGTLKSELAELGLRRSTIYPDLHNFVLELKDRLHW
jgi:hypothetical protein